jgi:hypothetical protein
MASPKDQEVREPHICMAVHDEDESRDNSAIKLARNLEYFLLGKKHESNFNKKHLFTTSG